MRRVAWFGLFLLGSIGCSGGTVAPDAADAPHGSDASDHGVVSDVADTVVVDSGPDAAPDAGPQPLGSPCAVDSDCMSNICVTSAATGLPVGCAAPCAQDTDCISVGSGFVCALDREPSATRFVCNNQTGTGGLEGDACTGNMDCTSLDCVTGVCRTACMDDTTCTAGSRCIAQPVTGGTIHVCGSPPITGPTVEDYTVFDETDFVDSLDQRNIAVPADAVSLAFITQDMEGSNLLASVPLIIAPDGTKWVDSMTWNGIADQPVRELLGITQVNTALAPSSDTLHVLPGQYQVGFALFNDTTAMTNVHMRRVRATVRIKRAPGGVLPATGTVHLRIFCVGISIDSATAPSDSRLQNAIRQMQQVYGSVGVSVVVDGYADITGSDATTYMVIDSQQEFGDLLTRSASSTGDVVNIFLVSSISPSAGLEGAIGMAGDIVGPPGIHGTVHSGVVVGYDSTGQFGVELLGQTLAHETGHYLGLWHTHESSPPCTTTIDNSCALFQAVDPISDTPADDASASAYLMYWQANGSNLALSNGEGIVMRSNPLVQ